MQTEETTNSNSVESAPQQHSKPSAASASFQYLASVSLGVIVLLLLAFAYYRGVVGL
ncbi:hypothetical protein [Leptolyngbya sp. FACHB-261]|uniref:hypothetical protein n=1 Tax=Leptolyngbya sp. FACHB-261 TaxID=2692806 RepID=UPI0016878952|nr:hypothetical protein [Leptolyngbya sp. FACHB-261]